MANFSTPVLSGAGVHPGRRRVLGLITAGVVGVVLAGCAGPARIPGDGQAFERTGRFAVNVTEPGVAPEAVQGGFAWRDGGRVLRLDLTNPLGSTLARITVQPSGAVLEHSDGSIETAADADALLSQVVGVAMPVANLRHWLQGRTGAGKVEALQQDSQGRPESFTQEGWRLRLSRYDALGPGLLRLDRRDGGRQISVRLAIDHEPAPKLGAETSADTPGALPQQAD